MGRFTVTPPLNESQADLPNAIREQLRIAIARHQLVDGDIVDLRKLSDEQQKIVFTALAREPHYVGSADPEHGIPTTYSYHANYGSGWGTEVIFQMPALNPAAHYGHRTPAYPH